MLRRLGYVDATPQNLEINNIMCKMHTPRPIDLDRLMEAYPERVKKMKSKFHGCSVSIDNSTLGCMVFATGMITLVGAKDRDTVYENMQRIAMMVAPFVMNA